MSGRSARERSASAEADVAQLAERVLGKDEVTSSILVIGSSLRSRLPAGQREAPAGKPREGCPPESRSAKAD